MNLAIPRENPSEILLYIWKIIDLPNISLNDLLYKISFELFLLSPENAKEFIVKSIENKLIVKDNEYTLSLSQELNKRLKSWQKKQKEEISRKMNPDRRKKSVQNAKSNFTTLLNAFSDKRTQNRAATVSSSAFEIVELDFDNGIIKANVSGSKEDSYYIELNTNEKKLRHNCDDFQTMRADNKKFCKHLVKIFLILKEKNEELSTNLLNEIAKNVNDWEFSD
jgi:hypothetical protein